ncbi:MAG TPA: hypothetical protein VL306_02365 [Methylomirabilota bacterium]|nr:hypothetical protein [Methylomirabilota bacterium]
MNKKLIDENKGKLLEEQARLQKILNKDDVADSEIPGGHKPKFSELGSEDGENASEVENFANDLSVTEDLVDRLDRVESALKRIEDGTYGKCMVGGEEIEEARMQAEPTAMTCVVHSK